MPVSGVTFWCLPLEWCVSISNGGVTSRLLPVVSRYQPFRVSSDNTQWLPFLTHGASMHRCYHEWGVHSKVRTQSRVCVVQVQNVWWRVFIIVPGPRSGQAKFNSTSSIFFWFDGCAGFITASSEVRWIFLDSHRGLTWCVVIRFREVGIHSMDFKKCLLQRFNRASLPLNFVEESSLRWFFCSRIDSFDRWQFSSS